MKATRAAGVLVRPGGTAVAVAPPLTAGPAHFDLIAAAIGQGLDALLEGALVADSRHRGSSRSR